MFGTDRKFYVAGRGPRSLRRHVRDNEIISVSAPLDNNHLYLIAIIIIKKKITQCSQRSHEEDCVFGTEPEGVCVVFLDIVV